MTEQTMEHNVDNLCQRITDARLKNVSCAVPMIQIVERLSDPEAEDVELNEIRVASIVASCIEILDSVYRPTSKKSGEALDSVPSDSVPSADVVNALNLLAVLSRNEEYRKVLVDGGCLPRLKAVVGGSDGTGESSIHALRALANVCIDNDSYRLTVASDDEGARSIVEYVGKTADQVNALQEALRVEKCPQLILQSAVCAGTILNLCNGNEEVTELFVSAGVVPHIMTFYSSKYVTSTVRLSGLAALEALLESNNCKRELCVGENPKLLFETLRYTTDEAYEQRPAELIESLVAENDELRRVYVETVGVTELIRLANEEALLRDVASKILAIVFADDEIMQKSLDDPNLNIVSTLKTWCDSDDKARRANAAFALGNLARSDSACEMLMAANVGLTLIRMLDSEDAREIHAVFGALRNMAVAKESRMLLIKAGLLGKLPKWVESFHMPVRFLIASILRTMTSRDVEVGGLLGSDENVLDMAMKLSGVDDEGTSCEAARAIANIVKSSPRKDVIDAVCEAGGVKAVAILLKSKHMILQNDGLMVLCLLGAIKGDELSHNTHVKECTDEVVRILTSESSVPESVRQNGRQWYEIVLKHDMLKNHLGDATLVALVNALASCDTEGDNKSTSVATVI
eukprot:CFRG6825T1